MLQVISAAGGARYADGVDETGNQTTLVDHRAATLSNRAAQWHERPLAFIEDREIFGDLAEHPQFTRPYERILRSLHERGVAATLEQLDIDAQSH